MDNLVKQVNDLKKEATKREQQKKEMADVVEQANLAEIKGRRPIKMGDAFVRPALDGKRLPGEVEIHQNGIRYQSMGPQKVGTSFSLEKAVLFWKLDCSNCLQMFCSVTSNTSFFNPAITNSWSLFISI